MPQSFRRLQGPHRGLSRPLHRSVGDPSHYVLFSLNQRASRVLARRTLSTTRDWTEITNVITLPYEIRVNSSPVWQGHHTLPF
jgi:hypothetical protein